MGYQALSRKKRVALLLGADISDGRTIRGGVVVVALFIYQQLLNSGRYAPHYISMSMSPRDKKSVRLLSPSTWKSGTQLVEGTWRDTRYTHAGAFLTEFEIQRYMPRKTLTDLLAQFDLIQVVSGSPAIANVAKKNEVPVCLFTATLTRLERKPVLPKAPLLRKIYGYATLPIISYIEKQALQRTDHVFAETLYAKQALLPYIDEEKVTTDTIGIDVQQFCPIEKRRDDYILCTGRLNDPRKNVKMLFRAYALLRQQISDAPKLILAGMSGPIESDWALAGELRILDYVEFYHEVPPTQLVALYQNAALFVLSSDEEGLGIVLLEAMACATPVVSTRCGGPDSVVSEEEVGFLTPVGNAHAMADRMAWILQNPAQRRKMGEAGREMVVNRFSKEVVGQKYLDVYDRLLGNYRE